MGGLVETDQPEGYGRLDGNQPFTLPGSLVQVRFGPSVATSIEQRNNEWRTRPSDPPSGHIEFVAFIELPVLDAKEPVLIPGAKELEIGERVRIIPKAHLVQLDERYR